MAICHPFPRSPHTIQLWLIFNLVSGSKYTNTFFSFQWGGSSETTSPSREQSLWLAASKPADLQIISHSNHTAAAYSKPDHCLVSSPWHHVLCHVLCKGVLTCLSLCCHVLCRGVLTCLYAGDGSWSRPQQYYPMLSKPPLGLGSHSPAGASILQTLLSISRLLPRPGSPASCW